MHIVNILEQYQHMITLMTGFIAAHRDAQESQTQAFQANLLLELIDPEMRNNAVRITNGMLHSVSETYHTGLLPARESEELISPLTHAIGELRDLLRFSNRKLLNALRPNTLNKVKKAYEIDGSRRLSSQRQMITVSVMNCWWCLL